MQRVNNVFADVINESPSCHMANTLVSCILNSITRSHIILQIETFSLQLVSSTEMSSCLGGLRSGDRMTQFVVLRRNRAKGIFPEWRVRLRRYYRAEHI